SSAVERRTSPMASSFTISSRSSTFSYLSHVQSTPVCLWNVHGRSPRKNLQSNAISRGDDAGVSGITMSGPGCDGRRLHRLDQIPRGQPRKAVDDEEIAAVAAHGLALDAVLAVLRSVDVDVRLDLLQKLNGIGFVEDVHVVDHPQREQHLGA